MCVGVSPAPRPCNTLPGHQPGHLSHPSLSSGLVHPSGSPHCHSHHSAFSSLLPFSFPFLLFSFFFFQFRPQGIELKEQAPLPTEHLGSPSVNVLNLKVAVWSYILHVCEHIHVSTCIVCAFACVHVSTCICVCACVHMSTWIHVFCWNNVYSMAHVWGHPFTG